MFHGYEQQFKYIQGLLSQNGLPFILPKQWWSHLTGERVSPYNVFKILEFEKFNAYFSTENLFIRPSRLRN